MCFHEFIGSFNGPCNNPLLSLIDWSTTTFNNVLFLTCNQSRGTNVAGAHNRIDKIFFCASPPKWLTCKSRITFILQGDKMYLKALNSGLVFEQGVEFLSR